VTIPTISLRETSQLHLVETLDDCRYRFSPIVKLDQYAYSSSVDRTDGSEVDLNRLAQPNVHQLDLPFHTPGQEVTVWSVPARYRSGSPAACRVASLAVEPRRFPPDLRAKKGRWCRPAASSLTYWFCDTTRVI
jgi:hypothetical protein